MKFIGVYLLPCLVASVCGVNVFVDTSAATDLADFGRQVKTALENWYRPIAQLFDSPSFKPIELISVRFDANYVGKAYFGWTGISGSIVGGANYYRAHKDDVGSMVHEMTHIIQQFFNCGNFGWVSEGLADYVRYWHFEPDRKPGKPAPGSHYLNGNEVAAYFFNYVDTMYPMEFPMTYMLNKQCRETSYNSSIFTSLTGKTADQLWEEMML